MTEDQIIEALKRRARGEGYSAIAKSMKITDYQLRKTIIPNFMDTKRIKERMRVMEERKMRPKCHRHQIDVSMPIPREVLFDRDYRMQLAPRSLTAAFCNDPLPGYSALDKRGA